MSTWLSVTALGVSGRTRDAAGKYPGLVVAGQFKTDEQYGAVLAKGSPNTRPLSEVIDQLREEGVLDQLFQKYFPEQVNIPPLG